MPMIIVELELDDIENMNAAGGWASGYADVIIDPGDGGDPITVNGIATGGRVGYGAGIPECQHGAVRAAGYLWGYGSMSAWQIERDGGGGDGEWNAAREHADAVLDTLTDTDRARIVAAFGAEYNDDDNLYRLIEEARVHVDGLDDTEEEWLREAVARAIYSPWEDTREDLANVLAKIEMPNGSGAVEALDDDRWYATESYLDEVRLELVASSEIDEPIGDVEWVDVDAIGYVQRVDGSEPGDCSARWGSDKLGLWWADDGDDSQRVERWGPFATEAEARARAHECAEDNREPGSEGDADAEAYTRRLVEDAEGAP